MSDTATEIVLLGCGRMGGAMLRRWLESGLSAPRFHVIEPNPDDWLSRTAVAAGVRLNAALPPAPACAIIAVKPQLMGAALPQLTALPATTLFVSIAAGTTLSVLDRTLGGGRRIVRAMPNTPAMVGRGITALVGNSLAGSDGLALARDLLSAVGRTVDLPDETMMDAVTALSGSGPAYVFHLVEAMTAAGIAQGLPEPVAIELARATVAGAGEMLHAMPTPAERLRHDVTSPGGTTEAALRVLMDAEAGLAALMARTVDAAATRSRELGK